MTGRVFPRFRPGIAVVRRDSSTLQVGVRSPHRVILPDDPAVRRLLTALSEPPPRWLTPRTPAAIRAWEALLEADLVITDGTLHADRTQVEVHGPSWPARAESRLRACVQLSGRRDLTDPLATLLHAEGVAARLNDTGEPPAEETTLWVLLGSGVVARPLLDHLRGPALPVSLIAGVWEIGPFLIPRSGTCLRCVDAGRLGEDPRWPLIAEQLAHLEFEPPRADLASSHLALTCAARDILAWCDGEEPASLGAVVSVAAGGLPERTVWPRQRQCGCSWGDHLLTG